MSLRKQVVQHCFPGFVQLFCCTRKEITHSKQFSTYHLVIGRFMKQFHDQQLGAVFLWSVSILNQCSCPHGPLQRLTLHSRVNTSAVRRPFPNNVHTFQLPKSEGRFHVWSCPVWGENQCSFKMMIQDRLSFNHLKNQNRCRNLKLRVERCSYEWKTNQISTHNVSKLQELSWSYWRFAGFTGLYFVTKCKLLWAIHKSKIAKAFHWFSFS